MGKIANFYFLMAIILMIFAASYRYIGPINQKNIGYTNGASLVSPPITSSESINVIGPSPTAEWIAGQFLNISWNSVGTSHDLQVWLYGDIVNNYNQTNSNYQQSLAEVTPAPDSGTYFWPIPLHQPRGNYYVEVYDNLYDVWGDSAWFTIQSPYSITVTTPSNASSWSIGTTHDIQWNSNTIGTKVDIDLWDGSTLYALTSSPVPNTGSYSWTIQAWPAGNYSIEVIDDNTSGIYDWLHGFSQYFTLTTSTGPSGSTPGFSLEYIALGVVIALSLLILLVRKRADFYLDTL